MIKFTSRVAHPMQVQERIINLVEDL